ncbi:thioredoxin domain-containing protein [Vibrio rumoiensis]|uniref:Thiol-disulfide isomerase n=1 Tax=Vibrio rumoiensis 1S-45 TaxID=1188252 RepID=A0A1E5DZF7_9VIBR|nr:thioredoxin domain-containing protein [Vibrio rumoiensis]OEF23253.1 thiol-disulfide isomerase [Vibrio rumoiensis 1S-45]
MPKYFKSFLLFALTLIFLSGCSESGTPKLGEQYKQLSTPLTQTDIKPVTEVFSLTCGHCRNMEASLPELEQLTHQKFGKVHVTFNEQAQVAALIYYAAVMQLNQIPDESMMKDLFAAVQLGDGATITQQQQTIEQVFTSRHMISPYSFDGLQQKALYRYLDNAMDISKQGGFNAVPTFIVNGKYEVLIGGHKDIQGIANTINFLLKQP